MEVRFVQGDVTDLAGSLAGAVDALFVAVVRLARGAQGGVVVAKHGVGAVLTA